MADFTYTNRVGNSPLTVSFSDTSTESYTGRKWLFGDGESLDGNVTSTSHTYKVPGVYTVTLIGSNSTNLDQEVKKDIIYVNEDVEDSRMVIAESKDRKGVYWKLYLDLDGKLVFETSDYKKVTEESVAVTSRWMFIEYHVEEDKFYVGTYAKGRREKPYKIVAHEPEMIQTPTGVFKIAANSSFTIDDLKVWEVETDLIEYFHGLRGRAGFLDPTQETVIDL
jgi:PKD repeat protein